MSNFDDGFGVVRQLLWSVHMVLYNDSKLLEALLLLQSHMSHGSQCLQIVKEMLRLTQLAHEVLEALDLASPSGEQLLLRWNSSGENVSYAVSFKGTELSVILNVAARVPTDSYSCLPPVTWE